MGWMPAEPSRQAGLPGPYSAEGGTLGPPTVSEGRAESAGMGKGIGY